jgi:hypothetical protein
MDLFGGNEPKKQKKKRLTKDRVLALTLNKGDRFKLGERDFNIYTLVSKDIFLDNEPQERLRLIVMGDDGVINRIMFRGIEFVVYKIKIKK